jgi:anaerobic magnesium-protoporphyrin IX monomethyl ester cyclase
MKFSFVIPSPDIMFRPPERWRTVSFSSSPPLGVLYLATILQSEGVEVSILDQAAKGFSTEETVKWSMKENPDILGFSVLAGSTQTATSIADEVKKENPRITTVFGGYNVTFNAERILKKYPSIDIVVRGEAEYTVIELAKRLERRNELKDVLGITFRKKQNTPSVISTRDRPLIERLDSLLFPDRKLLDADYGLNIAGASVATKKFTSIISSRGCPYRCRFCACQRMARNVWRPRSVENLLEEIRFLVSQGYEQFMFVDDNFTTSPKRVARFCQEVRKEKLEIEWIFEGRVDLSSYDLLRETVKAGARIVLFGIESANQKVLDYYDKRITPEQSRQAVENARKAGVDVVSGAFIVGAPNETMQEIENTLRFAQQLELDIPLLNVLTAYPGTDLWTELTLKGILNEDQHWENGAVVSQISSDTVPYQEIDRLVQEYFRSFFLRPKYLLTQTIRLLKSSYRSAVVLNNVSRVGSIWNRLRYLF